MLRLTADFGQLNLKFRPIYTFPSDERSTGILQHRKKKIL